MIHLPTNRASPRPSPRNRLATVALGLASTALLMSFIPANAGVVSLKVDGNGTIHVPAQAVPISSYLSPQAKSYVTAHLQFMASYATPGTGVPQFMYTYLRRQRALYPVVRRDTHIGGVHAFEYLPKNGISPQNRQRVLIELHGGGFNSCWPMCAQLESIPIASLARIRVIAVDYRQGPKYRFPAASEDVAAVYRALLKRYRPHDIGIYGCSAGGMLTAMAAAWFEHVGLPEPGAIGMFCAGAVAPSSAIFGGDATYTAFPTGEAHMLTPAKPGSKQRQGLSYFDGANPNDPMVAPATSLPTLAKFPPTLIVTGTRDFAMSAAVYTATRLTNAGVDAELHVWEGLFHGFFYNPDVPESRACYGVIVGFFNHHLGH